MTQTPPKEPAIDPKVADAAFRALKGGGLVYDDPDLVKLFDLSTAYHVGDRVLFPPKFVADAKRQKPDLFFNARTADMSEINARIKAIGQEAGRAAARAAQENLLASLRQRYPGK